MVTRSVNNINSDLCWSKSGYKGVGLHKESGLFYSRIKVNGHVISMGYHKTPEAANVARLLKERKLFGIQPRRLTAFIEAGIDVADAA